MIKTFRGGRTVLSGKDYTDHKRKVWEAQGKRCADCGLFISFQYTEFHHAAGRGMSGSKRSDLDPLNRVLCGGPAGCHEAARFEHIKKKIAP